MDAFQLPAGEGKVAGDGGSTGQNQGVVFAEQVIDANVDAYFGVTFKLMPSSSISLIATGHDPFFQFEVGYSIAEQTAGFVIPFEDGDGVAGGIQLSGGGEAGGAGAYDRLLFCRCAAAGLLGFYKTFVKGYFDDMFFYFLDGYRRLVDAQDAAAFAGRGADPACEFGEVIG